MMEVSEIMVSYTPSIKEVIKITSSSEVERLVRKYWNKDTLELYEEVKVVYLNKANNVLGIYDLSKGGISSSIVDIKIILSIALKSIASGIILVHNHPSGNTSPSKSDLDITKKLKLACGMLDIQLLDHIIITKDTYISFVDDGIL